MAAELAINLVLGPIVRCAAAALGRLVDRRGAPVTDPAHTPKGGKFLVRCCLLNRRGQGTVNASASPQAAGCTRRRRRAQVLCDCHDSPLGGHFGRAKTGSLVLRLAFCVGQDYDVTEYVHSSQTCQSTKAEHGSPCGLLHPLPLPSLRCGIIGVDCIAGLPTTAACFDMIQNTSTCCQASLRQGACRPCALDATATDAAVFIRDMCLRSCARFPYALVVDHDAKFTSEEFAPLPRLGTSTCSWPKSMCSCLVVGSAYHQNNHYAQAWPAWCVLSIKVAVESLCCCAGVS